MKNPSNPVHLMLPKSQQRSCSDNISMNRWHVFLTVSRHASNYILLGRVWHFPGTPWIVFSSTTCYCVTLFSHSSITLPTIFTLIYFSLYSQLHFFNHGTYGQPGDESLFTEESWSTPWDSTCMCIHEYSQSSLPIKCLNFQPSFRV